MQATPDLSLVGEGLDSCEWLTVLDAAKYLRLLGKNGQPSTYSVRNLVNQGKIPFYKPLGRLMFRKGELDKFIESSRNRGG